MRNVYLSFLGLGKKQLDGSFAYDPTIYELNGHMSTTTAFVQAAEYEILGADRFDTAIIVDTEKSHKTNFTALENELIRLGAVDIHVVTIDEEMTAQGQWRWFETILSSIEPDDNLTVDLTHGYRAAPIIFSAAINFLQNSKNVQLEAVYYGVFEKEKELGYAPIIDMVGFYSINEWAEGVNRLVEDANAGKLARVANRAPAYQFGELGDPQFVSDLQELTDTIKNVNANSVNATARNVLNRIGRLRNKTDSPAAILLDLLADKFSGLAAAESADGRYDGPYFQVQIALARLLLEHRLFMQAYTVMRESLASLGMIGFEREGMNAKKRKKRRQKHAEVFIKFFQVDEHKWNFAPANEAIVNRMKPFYEEFKSHGIEKRIRAIAWELSDYRNGFDHAWMGKPYKADIAEKGLHFLTTLENILESLDSKGLLP
jgi:CRISPR-associated Csx2 family protein